MATLKFKSKCFDSDAGQEVRLFHRRARQTGGQSVPLGWSRALAAPVYVAVALLCLPGRAVPQQNDGPPMLNSGAQTDAASASALHPAAAQDPFSRHVEEHMAGRRNSERQKTLIADTDRLLALAQQLKTDVDKSDKDTLSIDVVKRAEQIEKLARNVKEKMRGS